MDIQEALKEIREHDSERAFRYIYDTTYNRAYRIAIYYVGNENDAEELALEFLANIWSNRHTMLFPRNWSTWSFVVVRNMACNYLKRQKNNRAEELFEQMDDTVQSPDQLMEDEELFRHYEEALSALPDRCREIYSLVKEEGHSYSEVADMLQISAKTVDAQIQKAVKYIRKEIESYLSGASDGAKYFMSLLLL